MVKNRKRPSNLRKEKAKRDKTVPVAKEAIPLSSLPWS